MSSNSTPDPLHPTQSSLHAPQYPLLLSLPFTETSSLSLHPVHIITSGDPPSLSIMPPRSSVKLPGHHLQLSSLCRVPITPFCHCVLQPAARELNQSHRANICTHVSPDDRQDGPSALGPHTPVLRKQREPALHSTRAGEEGWVGGRGLPFWITGLTWPFGLLLKAGTHWLGSRKKMRWRKMLQLAERGSKRVHIRDRDRGGNLGREAQRLNGNRHPKDGKKKRNREGLRRECRQKGADE